jgi:hypothetical protein
MKMLLEAALEFSQQINENIKRKVEKYYKIL